jgi:hypothetical protein
MRPRNAVLPFLLLLIAGANAPLQASSGIYQRGTGTLFYLPLDGPDAGKQEGCSIIDPHGVLSYIPDRFGNTDAAIHAAGTGSASDDFYISCQNTKIAGSSSQVQVKAADVAQPGTATVRVVNPLTPDSGSWSLACFPSWVFRIPKCLTLAVTREKNKLQLSAFRGTT